MGNAMTFISRFTVRKVRRFNVHNRAERYLKKHEEKAERAPLYEATMREVERLAKEMPDLTEELKRKDEGFLSNLHKVYVTSDGDNKDGFSKTRVDSSGESRFLDAVNKEKDLIRDVPPGKYTLQQALTIIKNYQENPILNTHDSLAKQFNLPLAVVAKITKSVKIFDFYDCKPKETQKNILMQTLIPSSWQGVAENELVMKIWAEQDRRVDLFNKRMEELEAAKKTGQKVIEDPIIPLISQQTQDKLDKVYMETDIYRKTGKLPPEPTLIEEGEFAKLRLSDTKKIDAGRTEKNKESDDKKDESEEKKKAASQT